jgi:hypothetical protein
MEIKTYITRRLMFVLGDCVILLLGDKVIFGIGKLHE